MSISLTLTIVHISHVLAKPSVLLVHQKEKAFQGLVLPERLFEISKMLLVLLGSCLLSLGYNRDHGVHPGGRGREGGADQRRRHGVTRQVLLRVFPKSNH